MGIETNLSTLSFLSILLVSLSSSFLLAAIYSFVGEKTALSDNGIFRVIPGLSLAMTTIFCVLQFSVPLSLGLLGSLSIVRYRNPIKNPVDIGFILLTIAISLLAATSNFVFILILLTFTFIIGVVWLRPKIVGKYLNKTTKVVLTLKIAKNAFLENEKNYLSSLNKVFSDTIQLQSISEENDYLHVCYGGIGDDKLIYSAVKEIFPKDCDVNMYYEF
jgi:hypothetical protein